jgi:cell division protein FtsB
MNDGYLEVVLDNLITKFRELEDQNDKLEQQLEKSRQTAKEIFNEIFNLQLKTMGLK